MSARFNDLQTQIEVTSEYVLLDVHKDCVRRVNSYLDRMSNLRDETKELQEGYHDYRERIVNALSLREQLTDAQVQGLFGELDNLCLEYVDRQIGLL